MSVNNEFICNYMKILYKIKNKKIVFGYSGKGLYTKALDEPVSSKPLNQYDSDLASLKMGSFYTPTPRILGPWNPCLRQASLEPDGR